MSNENKTIIIIGFFITLTLSLIFYGAYKTTQLKEKTAQKAISMGYIEKIEQTCDNHPTITIWVPNESKSKKEL